jgi:hypothetical protein
LAQRHIDQNLALADVPSVPLAVPDSASLREGLKSLPPEVTCAVWDATVAPPRFHHTSIDDLLEAIDET